MPRRFDDDDEFFPLEDDDDNLLDDEDTEGDDYEEPEDIDWDDLDSVIDGLGWDADYFDDIWDVFQGGDEGDFYEED